ncbi:MAG TPA: transposase [Spongiibacteraceae bacterium]|nr:transposase [Spongiibacteraceae bacterium]HCS26228.1 transposase [Spongiibacteraceae bacterium]
MAQSNRLRFERVSESHRIYLVTVVCLSRRRVFSDFQAGRCAVQAMTSVAGSAHTLCYVVMPDHVHWLLQLEQGAELSRVVQKMKSVTSKYLHTQGVGGKIWQRGFHDHALRRDEDVAGIARYVVANPLRAGLVDSLREYPLWDAVWL